MEKYLDFDLETGEVIEPTYYTRVGFSADILDGPYGKYNINGSCLVNKAHHDIPNVITVKNNATGALLTACVYQKGGLSSPTHTEASRKWTFIK